VASDGRSPRWPAVSAPARAARADHRRGRPGSGGGKRLTRAYVHSVYGLRAAAADAPEWAAHFSIARTLGVPVHHVDTVPLFWIVAARMQNEAEAAVRKAEEARKN
jgi:hypothetical protein